MFEHPVAITCRTCPPWWRLACPGAQRLSCLSPAGQGRGLGLGLEVYIATPFKVILQAHTCHL